MLNGCKKFLVEGNFPQSWPWKQNGTLVLVSCDNSWSRELLKKHVTDRDIEKKLDFEPESPSVTGKVSYHYNSLVTGVYMACIFHRNSRGKTSQIEWLFESNLGSFGCSKCSTVVWLPLNPSCKGNLLTRIGWALLDQIVTWCPKYGICKKLRLHSNPRYTLVKAKICSMMKVFCWCSRTSNPHTLVLNGQY